MSQYGVSLHKYSNMEHALSNSNRLSDNNASVMQKYIPDYSLISPMPYSKSNRTMYKTPEKSGKLNMDNLQKMDEQAKVMSTENVKNLKNNSPESGFQNSFIDDIQHSLSQTNKTWNINQSVDLTDDNFVIKSGSLLEKKIHLNMQKSDKENVYNLNKQESNGSINFTSLNTSKTENISSCSTAELQSISERNNFDEYSRSNNSTTNVNSNKEEFMNSIKKELPRKNIESFENSVSKSMFYEDSVISYDHKQFLRVALEGNDFSDVTATSINSEMNGCMPHNSTLVNKMLFTSTSISTISKSNAQDAASSIRTVDASKLISSYSGTRSPKRLGLFRALYEKAKESLRVRRSGNRPKLNCTTFCDRSMPYANSEMETVYVEGLIGDSYCEMSKRKQLLLARQKCLEKEEFQDSDQQVEVERQLLLTAAKIRGLQSVMNKIDYEQNGILNITQSRGSLTVMDIVIPLKSFEERDFSQYYVCILSYDRCVYATDYATAVDSKISFSDTNIIFNNVKDDFCITIELFCLKLRKSLRNFSHESKYNLKMDSTCPTPQILISPTRTWLRSSKRYLTTKSNNDSDSSRFCFQGSIKLNFTNITPQGHYSITGVANNSFIHPEAEISLKAEVYFPQECTGFLTIGNEAGGCAYWNRKWCQLQGWVFKFWNYPDQQNKYPAGLIDLRNCVSSEILPADRQICSRNFTLLIETRRMRQPGDRNSIVLVCESAHTVVRNFIAADTRAELIKWQTIFNDVLHTLRQWNTLIPDSIL